MQSVDLRELVAYLDQYLDVSGGPDYPGAFNGLQVENSGSVQRIVACVDACLATIEVAVERGANLMIVHHGLYWGAGVTPLTDHRYRRVSRLLANDIAVYSAHLPLDAHPEVGNNVQLARGIGLAEFEPFGEYEGLAIGVRGELDVSRDELATRLVDFLGSDPFTIRAGPNRVRALGIITGGAAEHIAEASAAGLDTFVTGEGSHHNYFEAEELGLNVFFAGHYATETLGVKALAEHVAERFGCEWEFIDHPTGL